MPGPNEPPAGEGGPGTRPPAVLVLVFGLSGCAALLFEIVWFRQAGLMLGNTVWTSSTVLASFMAGLALGNLLAARRGALAARPIALYAQLETAIAATGLGLVLLFPLLTPRLAPLLGTLTDSPAGLGAARALVAGLLMLVPTTAMGATLPVLAAGLTRDQAAFGRLLGGLYGWNTLGAVAGALLAELAFIPRLGLRGTGALAAGLDLVAAAAAYGLYRGLRPPPVPAPASAVPRDGALARALVTAALAGAVLLMLEVVWFRFLLLWVNGNSVAFALMVAVVLAGIGGGGLCAAALLRRWPDAPRATAVVAALACVATVSGYAGFRARLEASPSALYAAGDVLRLAAQLMLPTALLSGVLFTLLGARLRTRLPGSAEAAGWLTLANTLGGLAGAAAGGLLLLPVLGVEGCLFGAALVYLLLAALNAPWRELWPAGRAAVLQAAPLLLAALVLGLFPFGLMRNQLVRHVAGRWASTLPASRSRLLAVREGLNETVMYLETSFWDQPAYPRLLTDSTSMSGDMPYVARYMSLFAWLPLALQPEARDALLISFGVGTTARALTDSPGLRSIDVVDTSRDILQLGRLAFAGEPRYPLDDARVRVHVEDGRFFLLTTDRRYDLITAEPPPPKNAGIASLYSREHFALIRARLREGGLATYWLPVAQLLSSDARAVTRAFCDAFPDCTLWSGSGYEWILMGSRGPLRAVAEPDFTRQWREPAVRARLAEVGLEAPEQLGLCFLADARDLQAWTDGTPPVDDDHPYRLSPEPALALAPDFAALVRAPAARERFARSPWVAGVWPPALRQRTLELFERQPFALSVAWPDPELGGLPLLVQALSQPDGPRAAALFLMASDARIERAAARARASGAAPPLLAEYEAFSALADRDWERAERLCAGVGPDSPLFERAQQYRLLALLLGGRRERAEELLRQAQAWPPLERRASWGWLLEHFDLPDVQGLRPGRPR